MLLKPILNANTHASYTSSELLNVLRSRPIDKLHEKNRIRELSMQYMDLPVEDWPSIKVEWDLSEKSQYYSADGFSEQSFTNSYGEPLSIAWIKMMDLDNALHGASIRKKNETWSVGCKAKVAHLIRHCVEGKPLTPAHIQPHKGLNALTIVGGHHRLAVCRALELELVPVLVEKKLEADLKAIINVIKIENATK